MKKNVIGAAALSTLIALALSFQLVLAHESITVGDYEIEIGWLSEPPMTSESSTAAAIAAQIPTHGAILFSSSSIVVV